MQFDTVMHFSVWRTTPSLPTSLFTDTATHSSVWRTTLSLYLQTQRRTPVSGLQPCLSIYRHSDALQCLAYNPVSLFTDTVTHSSVCRTTPSLYLQTQRHTPVSVVQPCLSIYRHSDALQCLSYNPVSLFTDTAMHSSVCRTTLSLYLQTQRCTPVSVVQPCLSIYRHSDALQCLSYNPVSLFTDTAMHSSVCRTTLSLYLQTQRCTPVSVVQPCLSIYRHSDALQCLSYNPVSLFTDTAMHSSVCRTTLSLYLQTQRCTPVSVVQPCLSIYRHSDALQCLSYNPVSLFTDTAMHSSVCRTTLSLYLQTQRCTPVSVVQPCLSIYRHSDALQCLSYNPVSLFTDTAMHSSVCRTTLSLYLQTQRCTPVSVVQPCLSIYRHSDALQCLSYNPVSLFTDTAMHSSVCRTAPSLYLQTQRCTPVSGVQPCLSIYRHSDALQCLSYNPVSLFTDTAMHSSVWRTTPSLPTSPVVP
uniref:Uncharacterized protein n=1 Tax=Timema shepardi TaxID=629360 RepID=A0A7R9AXW1_TIMSH|nr:unnamed protein product [Timema shepardi]